MKDVFRVDLGFLGIQDSLRYTFMHILTETCPTCSPTSLVAFHRCLYTTPVRR